MSTTLKRLELPLHKPLNEITGGIRRKLMTTNKMVENALIDLHTPKGVTLRAIYNFILYNNNLESLTNVRTRLIKTYIKSLQETKDIVNVTGRGLTGHFKLVNKVSFEQNILRNNMQIKKNKKTSKKEFGAPKMLISKIKLTVGKNKLKKGVTEKPKQATKNRLNKDLLSVFDTPIFQTQLSTSTPFIDRSSVPWAPETRKGSNRQRLSDVVQTPRSSLPKNKRKLHNPPKKG